MRDEKRETRNDQKIAPNARKNSKIRILDRENET